MSESSEDINNLPAPPAPNGPVPAPVPAAVPRQAAAVQLVDLRSISKPPNFGGSETEWKDWRFVFQSYIGLVHSQLFRAMGNPKNHGANPVPGIDTLNAEEQQLSRGLYHILVMTLKNRALAIVRSIQDNRGLEAWRKLCQHDEPLVPQRSIALLQGLLSPTFRQTSLQDWETYFFGLGAQLPTVRRALRGQCPHRRSQDCCGPTTRSHKRSGLLATAVRELSRKLFDVSACDAKFPP